MFSLLLSLALTLEEKIIILDSPCMFDSCCGFFKKIWKTVKSRDEIKDIYPSTIHVKESKTHVLGVKDFYNAQRHLW